METFGYKCAWFAIKTADSTAAATALRITDVHSCAWDAGVAAAYTMGKDRVFITPPIHGWVLCAGVELFELFQGEDFDPLIELITAASATLQTEVQFFATMRVIEGHVWIRAQAGKLLRAYAFLGESGETLCNSGTPTSEEQTLGLVFPDEPDDIDGKDTFPGEDDVLQLAGAWSINPGALTDIPAGTALLGRLPRQPATPKKPWWKFW